MTGVCREQALHTVEASPLSHSRLFPMRSPPSFTALLEQPVWCLWALVSGSLPHDLGCSELRPEAFVSNLLFLFVNGRDF